MTKVGKITGFDMYSTIVDDNFVVADTHRGDHVVSDLKTGDWVEYWTNNKGINILYYLAEEEDYDSEEEVREAFGIK